MQHGEHDLIEPGSTTRAYGWALLATHAVVWLFFASTRILSGITTAEPFCWPYFESCWRWRLPSPAHVVLVQLVYLSVGLVAGAALAHRRWRPFWWSLVILNLVLFTIVSLDYRFRANEFYMLFWVNGVYLVWPQPRWAIPVTIISCYFWAGVIKLNYEWLSGAVLYSDLWLIPKPWVPVACAYVVGLEMVMIWGLLDRRRWVFTAVLAQLALFHVQSLSQIHWFYPVLMAAILSWFVLDRVVGAPGGRPDLATLFRGRAPVAAYAVMALFASMQLAPRLYRGDSTLTGQGRTLALHMFEARQQCEVTATPSLSGATDTRIDLKVSALPPRMICDPVVYFNRAQNLCRARRGADPAFDFRLVMRAKRTTDRDFQTIIDEPDFCAGKHEYRLFENNVWLR